MTLYCIDNDFQYELEGLLRLFMPDEKIIVLKDVCQEPNAPYAIARYDKKNCRVFATLNKDGCERELTKTLNNNDGESDAERKLAGALFLLLCEEFSFRPKWGILTGVRPGKLINSLRKSLGEKAAEDYLTNELLVSPEKTRLAFEVARTQERILASSCRESFSLYISIPFCPSRCTYCSFVSHSISSPAIIKSIPEYVDLMCREIALTGKAARENKLRLESIYWGGGTPTVLEPLLLRKVFEAISQSFDLSTLRELTVEAGRPDTITKEKLLVLNEYGVSRLSINPQSFNDDVLKAIGRHHTSSQTVLAYKLAREAGFNNINADLIAALPGQTHESFEKSVKAAVDMGFDSITIHTLAKKRSSTLGTETALFAEKTVLTAKMLKTAETLLRKASYRPYYLYRQSKASGNYENVGWAKEEKECLYNIFMMEECHSVLAVGAGAVTKLKDPSSGYIERVNNFKYPYEYISRFDEILMRKNRISEFYGTYFIKGEN